MSMWMKSLSVTIQVKATKHHFSTVVFIIIDKFVLALESMNKILKCGHSNKTYRAIHILSCGVVYCGLTSTKPQT